MYGDALVLHDLCSVSIELAHSTLPHSSKPHSQTHTVPEPVARGASRGAPPHSPARGGPARGTAHLSTVFLL